MQSRNDMIQSLKKQVETLQRRLIFLEECFWEYVIAGEVSPPEMYWKKFYNKEGIVERELRKTGFKIQKR